MLESKKQKSEYRYIYLKLNFKLLNILIYLGFEVLTAVDMKISIFSVIMPCSPLKVSGLYGVMSQKRRLFNCFTKCDLQTDAFRIGLFYIIGKVHF
jgi:hypothetical protein